MSRDDWHDRRFAEDWDEAGNLSTNPDRLHQLSLLADLLAGGGHSRLLDLGIGSARVESAIERLHPGFLERCRVIGIDASDAMLALARRRCDDESLPGIELMQGDFARLDEIELPERPDAVICVQARHEVTHEVKSAVFSWVHDLLPAGAPFYILDRFEYPAGAWLDDWRSIWDWMRSAHSGEVLNFGEYHRRYSAKQDHVASVENYRDWLEAAGFETVCPYLCFNRALIAARA